LHCIIHNTMYYTMEAFLDPLPPDKSPLPSWEGAEGRSSQAGGLQGGGALGPRALAWREPPWSMALAWGRPWPPGPQAPIHRNFTKYTGISPNTPKYNQIHPNTPKYTKYAQIRQNSPNFIKKHKKKTQKSHTKHKITNKITKSKTKKKCKKSEHARTSAN